MTTNGMPSATRPIVNHPGHPPPAFLRSGTTFDPAAWEDAPPFLLPDPNKNERIARRNANHKTYREIGTNNMWHKYIQLGYYIFDDCMEFQQAWKSTANEAISKRYKIIWQSFHIHRMNDIPINKVLDKSANATARPYLQAKEPDFLLATDIEFEEKQFFETSLGDKEIASHVGDNYGWTEVAPKKSKKKTPPTSPELTGMPPNKNDDIDSMDISDDAMLGLTLARNTPLPDTDTDALEYNLTSTPSTQPEDQPIIPAVLPVPYCSTGYGTIQTPMIRGTIRLRIE
jgi:hypothetical protein